MSMIQDSVYKDEVRTAHLDEAHVGDIQGAWGTIRRGDTARRKTWFQRLLTLLVIGLEAVYWWLTIQVGGQTGPDPQGGGVVAGMLALMAIGGTWSCFVLRRSVFYVY